MPTVHQHHGQTDGRHDDSNTTLALRASRGKTSKKPAPNLIEFQFVMPVIIKDLFMFTD